RRLWLARIAPCLAMRQRDQPAQVAVPLLALHEQRQMHWCPPARGRGKKSRPLLRRSKGVALAPREGNGTTRRGTALATRGGSGLRSRGPPWGIRFQLFPLPGAGGGQGGGQFAASGRKEGLR